MSKSTLPSGFLGGQPRRDEIKIKPKSHKDAEFRVLASNKVAITMSTEQATKVVTKLTQLGTDKELPEYVFVQRKDHESIDFHIGFPENGSYTFMVFALPESDSSDSLPNVQNYLIHVERINRPAQPFPKAYTIFYKKCCVLEEPLALSSTTPYLDHTLFKLRVPGAEKVAVHANDEWHQLKKKGDYWEGSFNLLSCKDRNSKVTVNGSFEKDGSSYSVLLEYPM